jgi:hypothetical protein
MLDKCLETAEKLKMLLRNVTFIHGKWTVAKTHKWGDGEGDGESG